jgi:DNA-binding NtrC family response regulator
MVRQLRSPTVQEVLLVEDEPRLRDMLLRAMREMGMEPAGATSAEQALRMLEQRSFPVLIIDLNLPGIGGLELLRTVRGRWPDVQAIILTGFGDLDAARQAIHLEVVDFLTKPCALGDLEIALGRAFRRLKKEIPELPTARQMSALDHPKRHEPALPVSASSPLEFSPRESSESLSLEDVERRTILNVLEKHGGNRAATAAELGISIRKLYYRLSQYQHHGSGPAQAR